MRKVSYFWDGLIADFDISDSEYADFVKNAETDRFGEDNLMKARVVLDGFMERGREDDDIETSPADILAAAFIWNFFNANPEPDYIIEGDIFIVDLDGTGDTVEFAAYEDVEFDEVD